jgi:hypothetical protein
MLLLLRTMRKSRCSEDGWTAQRGTLRAIGTLHSRNLAFLQVLGHVGGIPKHLATGVFICEVNVG